MFLKKIVLFFVLCILTLSASLNLIAQAKDIYNITDEQLSEEGPLTQKDIDVYLGFFERNANLMKSDAKASKDVMIKATADFAKNNGVTIVRLRYLLEKIPYVLLLVSSSADNPPPFPNLKVSNDEKSLVKKNQSKIMETFKILSGQS
jgi:hypothetical protein